uniref:Uncharacterized protein n=1 Tax=Arundo donax TaxID=35708 RepID=A0A0A8YZK0_ARUDO
MATTSPNRTTTCFSQRLDLHPTAHTHASRHQLDRTVHGVYGLGHGGAMR